MKVTVPLVLASRSPRRKVLLEQLGLEFVVHESTVDESYEGELKPDVLVKSLARRKAHSVSEIHAEALTLAADTVVFHKGSIIGKPGTEREATQQLRRLSGSAHSVYTGFSLIHPPTEREVQAVEKTEVTIAQLDDVEIEAYVATGSPMDKAGGYGIQDEWGAVFVESIQGDYNTVVGLPLHRLYQVLRSNFSDLLEL